MRTSYPTHAFFAVACLLAGGLAVGAPVSQSGIDQLVLEVFLAYVVVLFPVLISLVYFVTKGPSRKRYIKSTSILYAGLGLSSLALLSSLQSSQKHVLFDQASFACFCLVTVASIILLVWAAVSSRKAPPNPSIERTSPGKPGAASHLKR